jgi:condensation domain-containing protein
MTGGAQPTSLLPAQESHWEWMCGLSPGAPGASRFLVVDNRFVDAALDEAAIRRAFADVTSRHDALRLVFDSVGCEPRLHIEPAVEPPVEYLDLSALTEVSQQHWIAELVFRENNRTFDLLRAPPWHAWYVRLGPERHFINACFSEIIADGWASKVFMEDLLTAHALHTGSAAVPEAPLSFAEMHAIQRRRLAPQEDRLAYWREQLLPFPSSAPFRPRITAETSVLTRSRIDVVFGRAVLASLRGLAWRSRTSLYIVLMAAYHVLLSVATGQDRTVLSTAVLGRTTSRERRSLLPCTIDLYVATTLSSKVSLRDAVRRTHESMDRALANLVSFTSIARAVNPDFDAERPWPDLHLCHGNFYAAAFEDPELSLAGMRVMMPRLAGRAPADPTATTLRACAMSPARRAVWAAYCGPSMEISHARDACALIYNGEMYPDDEMREHLDAYLWIVELMASSPDMTVGAIRDWYARPGAT